MKSITFNPVNNPKSEVTVYLKHISCISKTKITFGYNLFLLVDDGTNWPISEETFEEAKKLMEEYEG